MRRALVLLSGGLDSAVAYAWALREGHEPVGLSFLYPGRPRGEILAAREIVASAGRAELLEVDLPFLREAAEAAPDRFADAPPGYVAARNPIFYAVAAHEAQRVACEVVVGGHNAEDAARYPDASAGFFARLEAVIAGGLWTPRGAAPPRLVMPLLGLDRDGVVALGRALGVPMERTWSCYEDGEAPCGACPACARRNGLPSTARLNAAVAPPLRRARRRPAR